MNLMLMNELIHLNSMNEELLSNELIPWKIMVQGPNWDQNLGFALQCICQDSSYITYYIERIWSFGFYLTIN